MTSFKIEYETPIEIENKFGYITQDIEKNRICIFKHQRRTLSTFNSESDNSKIKIIKALEKELS